MKRRYFCVVLLAVASLSPIAAAGPGDSAGTGRAGGLGFGGDLMPGLPPQIDGRFGAMFSPLRVNGEIGDVNYDFDLRLMTLPFTMDWHPFKNGLRLSGGLIFNQSKIDLDTASRASLMIGGNTYSGADLGTVRGRATFPLLAPYIGIGWGNVFGKDGHWGIVGDLGVAFLGRPHVALTATGPIATNSNFMGDVAQEEKDLQDDLSIFRFYPVFSISLYYRF